jgi:hypothetical protein
MIFSGLGMRYITLFAFIVVLLPFRADSMKIQTSIAPEAGSHAEVLSPIGLAVGSRLDVSYKFVSNPTSGAVLYFLLFSRQQVTEYLDRVDNVEFPLSVLCESASIVREPLHLSGAGNLTLTVRSTDQYAAYIASCSTAVPAAIHLDVKYVNPDSQGKLSQHLPLEDMPSIQLQGFLSICYLLLLAAWLHCCYQNWTFVSLVHVLVALVLITRMVSSSTCSIRCTSSFKIKMLNH